MGTTPGPPPSDRPEGFQLILTGIYGDSRILGVFGYPVEHSLSPAMHNAAIAALGLHYVYIPFSVRPEDVGPAIRSLITLGIRGVNLTIPHKERVLPFLDEVASEARAVGAVNTVVCQENRLVGCNTDGAGFMAPLTARSLNLAGRQVVVLGAGGAARSVVYRLAREGARISIANRTRSRAESLADGVNAETESPAAAVLDWGDAGAIGKALAGAALLVNTTSIGMSPNVDEIPPVPPSALHPGLLVYDLVYRPLETRLLAAARSAGAQTLNGVPMLVHQGAEAFRIWTGVVPPVDVMERAVLEALAGATGR